MWIQKTNKQMRSGFFFSLKQDMINFPPKLFLKQFLAGNSKFPNTTTPMAMGEVEVAPARRQNLVPLHTYRPIFWILGQNCGGSQTQDLHHWFLNWVKTTNRQSYRHLHKRNALNRQMALHQDLYRFDPITKKKVMLIVRISFFLKRRLQAYIVDLKPLHLPK